MEILHRDVVRDLIMRTAAVVEDSEEKVIQSLKDNGANQVLSLGSGNYIGADKHGYLLGFGLMISPLGQIDLKVVNNRYLGHVRRS